MNTGDDIQVVTFRVGRQEFAFDILQIQRILRYEQPAPLPQAPAFLEGVVQYGGGAVPVVDLRKRFELEAPIREETRLMIAGSRRPAGGRGGGRGARGAAGGQRRRSRLRRRW